MTDDSPDFSKGSYQSKEIKEPLTYAEKIALRDKRIKEIKANKYNPKKDILVIEEFNTDDLF